MIFRLSGNGESGEVIIRTWQTAHKMKVQRGPLTEDRAKRQFSKNDISPSTRLTQQLPTALLPMWVQ